MSKPPNNQAKGPSYKQQRKHKKPIADGPTHEGDGLRSTLHGTIYQIKLLMHFLIKGLEKAYNFSLATEVKDAEKFDDVVFLYDNNNTANKEYRFLQVKHKLNKKKNKINFSDLLKDSDDDYSLLKYFVSYRKIIQNQNFSGEFKDFIIFTNIDFNKEVKGKDCNQKSYVSEITDNDISKPGGKCYKFEKGTTFYDKLKLLLKYNHANTLVANLAKVILDTNATSLPNDKLFKCYRGWLLNKVFDVKGDKSKFLNFQYDFINYQWFKGDEVLSNFKKTLITYIEEDFAKLKRNGKIRKKTRFIYVQDILKGTKLELNDHQITNNNNSLWLDVTDKEIDDFLDKLVFAVNQPSEDELDYINLDAISKSTKFNNTKLIAGAFLNNILDWVKTKKGIYLTSKNGRQLFEYLNLNVSSMGLVGTTLAYKSKIEKRYIFENDTVLEKIRKFVSDDNKNKQILIIFYENQLLSSIKILQANTKPKVNENILNDSKTLQSLIPSKISPFRSQVYVKAVQKVKAFLNDKNYPENDEKVEILNAINILFQADGGKNVDEDIYCDFDTLQHLIDTETCPIKGFKSDTCYQLVIDDIPIFSEVSDTLQNIIEILKDNPDKRIILSISREEEKKTKRGLRELCKKFEYDHTKCETLVDDNNNFCNLISESRGELLNQSIVTFQDKDLALSLLINEENSNVIAKEILTKLISKEKIIIGKSPVNKKYKEVKAYFVERTLQRQCVIIRNDIINLESDFFVTELSQVRETTLLSNQDIVLISEDENKFNELSECHQNRSVHWLKREDPTNDQFSLIWKRSQGSLLKLRKQIVNAQNKYEYTPEQVMASSDKIVIISSEPRMGKSTLLTHLATQIEVNLNKGIIWVVNIDLEKQMTQLSELSKINSIDIRHVMKFLCRAMKCEPFYDVNGIRKEMHEFVSAVSEREEDKSFKVDDGTDFNRVDLLDVHLFTYFYNCGKIVLFMDGFDKITPLFKTEVLNLLEALKHSRVLKIFVSTRHLVNTELEDTLGTFSYEITPLSDYRQINYILTKYWKSTLGIKQMDEERTKSFIDKLLELFLQRISRGDSNNMSEFLRVPEHVTMIATAYAKRFENFLCCETEGDIETFLSSLEKTFHLNDLYEQFQEIKLSVIYKDFYRNGLTCYYNMEDSKKKTLKNHTYFALLALFSEDELKGFIPEETIAEVKELMQPIIDAEEKTGFITQVKEGKPYFVHRSFAQYFAAKLLASIVNEKLDNQYKSVITFLYNIWTSKHSENRVLLHFLNYILTSDCSDKEIFATVLSQGDWHNLIEARDLNDICDLHGRTPLHLACLNFEWHSAMFLYLDEYRRHLLVQDKIFGWSPLHYAVASTVDTSDKCYDALVDILLTYDLEVMDLKDLKKKSPIKLALKLNGTNWSNLANSQYCPDLAALFSDLES